MNYQQAVVQEIHNLKQFATQDELNKLDFEFLEPFNPFRCIYGQMTNTCGSIRAFNLISKCSTSCYFESLISDQVISLLGEPAYRNFTALEHYITARGKETELNKSIIEYLRGEIDELPNLFPN